MKDIEVNGAHITDESAEILKLLSLIHISEPTRPY